ncbi:hypothetical protein [Jidongwangia harbinensis]|uniref:hypothetical protein n=1 Tax=Jidongwangia harbinensis TaxID=2878561 RepID=UPI001CD97E61|nr:hypothetical protein [Jidongwangia harbinensis]MCA2212429.1 hypothetical protein [Jidongwangia harbinensis]
MSYLEKGPTELFAPLDAEPDAPSRVDIVAAMATGRRHKRGRVAAAGAAVVALAGGTAIGGTLAFSGAAPEPLPDCVAVPLPMAGFSSIDVTGADPSGRYIAGQADPVWGQKSSVVVWRDHEIVDVLRRPGVLLSDFTSRGVGVGRDAEQRRAYVYRDGKLATLDGGPAAAFAVNEDGVIVGSVGDRPARWAAAGAAPTPLPVPSGVTRGAATEITDDGTIVGWLEIDDKFPRQAYLWRADGTHGPLTLPTVDGERAVGFEAESIRDGWIYGQIRVLDKVVTAGGPSASTAPGVTSLTAFKDLPFRYEVATGRWDRLSRPADRSRAFFYVGDRVLSLPPNPEADEPTYYTADTVGEDGRSAAGDDNAVSGGLFRPVSWQCE